MKDPSWPLLGKPGSEKLIRCHTNQGPNRILSFEPIDHLSDDYNRPDVIAELLETWDEKTALDNANNIISNSN